MEVCTISGMVGRLFLEEDVVYFVGHECPLGDVVRDAATGRGGLPTHGVHPLNESGRKQPVATSGSVPDDDRLEQQPRNRIERPIRRMPWPGS